MLLVDDLSELVRNIYQAVYDADHWLDAIASLMNYTRSRASQFTTASGDGPLTTWSAAYDLERGCLERIIPAEENCWTLPDLRVPASCDLEKGVAWLERLPSSSSWQLRYCRQFTDIRFSVWLVAEAGASQPRGTTLSIHKRVLDHVGQALRLAGRTPDLRYLREPTVVVDTDGAVLSASTSAGKILDRSGPILLRDGALAADDPEINDKLRKAITLSAEPDREVSVVKSTKEGERDHLIVVTPYPWSLTHLPIRAPVAIVRMLDTAGSGWLPQHVIDMFGFTKREAEVARCLLAGHSLESLCYSLGISRNTGKVHLRALFRKTSTSRQADLISLLSRLSH